MKTPGPRIPGVRSAPLAEAARAKLGRLRGRFAIKDLEVLLEASRETLLGAIAGDPATPQTRARLEVAIDRLAGEAEERDAERGAA